MLNWYCLGYTGLINYIIKINLTCFALLLKMSLVEHLSLHWHLFLLDSAVVECFGFNK